MNTFGPIDWYAYYGRPRDAPECLRRMGIPKFSCCGCSKDYKCGMRVELGSSSQCKHIRWWMYDNWPVLTGKIKAALSGSDTENGKR